MSMGQLFRPGDVGKAVRQPGSGGIAARFADPMACVRERPI
jgi:hypothetical protein